MPTPILAPVRFLAICMRGGRNKQTENLVASTKGFNPGPPWLGPLCRGAKRLHCQEEDVPRILV